MLARPYVLLSCAVSLDGCLDDRSPRRLILSGDEDLEEIDALRAGSDAVLVGAGTVRQDDPRLLVRSAQRRNDRVARGMAMSPLRVVLSGGGPLDPSARLFAAADAATLVYTASTAVTGLAERLGGRPAERPGERLAVPAAGHVEVADGGDPVDLSRVLADLAARGVERLLVEGGAGVHAAFLAGGLADELRLAVAPFFVGEPGAPRLFADGRFPPQDGDRAVLADVRRVGDVAVLRYGLSHRFAG